MYGDNMFTDGCEATPKDEIGAKSGKDMRLWYRQPASDWEEGLPIGNGYVGAMVLGTVEQDRIALNHCRLWRERRLRGKENPKVAHNLPRIREMFLDGKIIEASNAANNLLGTQKGLTGPDPFQPVGDLSISFADHEKAKDYCRELDLTTGVAKISYSHNDVNYVRELFASRTDGVVVVRISANRRESINCEVTLSRIDDPECTVTPWAKDNQMGLVGEFIEDIRFAATVAVLYKEGRMLPVKEDAAKIEIGKADEVLIIVSIATGKETDDPKTCTVSQIDEVCKKACFAALLRSHVAEHRKLMQRARVSFGDGSRSDIPTNERFSQLQAGQADPDLMSLVFQYGRYLLVSSSRPGGLPANLQGMWNEKLDPPWRSDFHHDCNIQMNYWPAENTGLSECAEPLFDYVESMLPAAYKAAKNLYGCRGIYIPLTGDPAAKCLKTEGLWSEWTGAAAWLAQHFWWHWEFTGDKEFLRRRVYSLYKEIALFYQDYLVKDPRLDSPHHGKLVTVPSQSPENFFVGGVKPVSLCIGATMDFELIHEVFTTLIEASKILNVDSKKRSEWQYILDNMPPLQIGKHGQLQEWLEDYEEGEVNHRHISHLYALFPGEQITPERTLELAQATEVTLDRRVSGGRGSPWAGVGAWYAACWARLGNGERAYDLLRSILERVRNGRLFAISNSNQQVDGNFSFTAAIVEMLLQSHNGEIRLLPALPESWSKGHLEGLRARGGFEVDIVWESGRLTQAQVKSIIGNNCRIRTSVPLTVKSNTETIKPDQVGPRIIEFATRPGTVYVLTP